MTRRVAEPGLEEHERLPGQILRATTCRRRASGCVGVVDEQQLLAQHRAP